MGKGVPNQKKKAERNACDKYLTPPSVVQQLLIAVPSSQTKTPRFMNLVPRQNSQSATCYAKMDLRISQKIYIK